MRSLLKENHVKYGLLMTGITLLWVALMHVTGVYTRTDGDSIVDLIFIIISPLVIWYLGIQAYKKLQNNKLSFKDGVKEGFRISVVYGLTSPFIFALYYLTLNQELLNYVRESYGLIGAPTGMVIFADMLVQFFASLVGGTLYGAIVSLFLKTKSEQVEKKVTPAVS